MGKLSLDDLKSKPPMTGWFNPRLLSRLFDALWRPYLAGHRL